MATKIIDVCDRCAKESERGTPEAAQMFVVSVELKLPGSNTNHSSHKPQQWCRPCCVAVGMLGNAEEVKLAELARLQANPPVTAPPTFEDILRDYICDEVSDAVSNALSNR